MRSTHLNLSSFIVFGMLIYILKIVVYLDGLKIVVYLDGNRHMCVNIIGGY